MGADVMGKYQSEIKKAMTKLGKRDDVLFLGQGVAYPDRIYGTLADVPIEKCIEMPIAENMQTGIAIGLALEGFYPVSIYQRMDFLLLASDQLINHLDKIETMSQGQYKPNVMTRTIIGAKKPIDAGPQHTQDFTKLFKTAMKHIALFDPLNDKQVKAVYSQCNKHNVNSLVIEKRELY
jgi:pyruvate/2-oxoglutarate/acetoin dehydrogenase E1 component